MWVAPWMSHVCLWHFWHNDTTSNTKKRARPTFFSKHSKSYHAKALLVPVYRPKWSTATGKPDFWDAWCAARSRTEIFPKLAWGECLLPRFSVYLKYTWTEQREWRPPTRTHAHTQLPHDPDPQLTVELINWWCSWSLDNTYVNIQARLAISVHWGLVSRWELLWSEEFDLLGPFSRLGGTCFVGTIIHQQHVTQTAAVFSFPFIIHHFSFKQLERKDCGPHHVGVLALAAPHHLTTMKKRRHLQASKSSSKFGYNS
jgi:hypothetical protein